MENFLRQLFFVAIFSFHNCEVYYNRPKIKSTDGDLILQPGLNKNIILKTNGPASKVYVDGVNLLTLNVTSRTSTDTTTSLNDYGHNGILRRLEKLEKLKPGKRFVNSTYFHNTMSAISMRLNYLERQLPIKTTTHGCSSNPCLHGGTCLELVNRYHCLCPPNWEGEDCDEDVNECRNFAGTDLGCQNGATCINKPGSYECICRSGWFGLHCTKKAKDCFGSDTEICGHGTCLPVTSGEGIKCICDQGWTTNGTGLACLTDVNECDPKLGVRCSVNPRVNCTNLPGSFKCGSCPSGYEGDGYVCSDIDECQSIPNGGCSTSPMVSCLNTMGSRICGSCPSGYEGDGVQCSWKGSCAINNGNCHPSAQCTENVEISGVQCICPYGMDGDGIGIHGCYISSNANNSLHCEGNPCSANGRCHSLRLGYTCICNRGFTGVHCEEPVNYCMNKSCLNGGVCKVDSTKIRGYRCECPSQFSGDLCQVHTKTCGGVLAAEEGSIAYPNSQNTYSHNSRCAWVIHTTIDKVINVTFSKFNLEEDPECLYDFLQIHDGRSSASQLIGRFCGNIYPMGGNIISSHNNLYFWFRSDQSVSKEGFALHWTSTKPVCGGELDASVNGHISSPGSPGKYPPNRDCYWQLSTTLGKKIQLHFFALDIEIHPNCSYDYLSIYDGEHTSDPLISKLCNSSLPLPIISAGSDILIHFHSDAFGSGNGFQITFAPLEGVPGCGGYFTEDRGEIISPSYNGRYLNNLLCDYKIKTSVNTKIKIEFKSFDVENSFRCLYDYLKIYDGPTSDSRLVGKFCGRNYIKTYTSSSNTLFIKFRSDPSVSAQGFKITYVALCQQTYVGDSGVVKSPGYPFGYPVNKICEYIIITDPGKSIQLSFQDFDLEENSYFDCQYDNVEIRDGPNINSSLLGRYCGGSERTPPVQISTHNYLYMRFTSDMSLSGNGFYANYTTIDKGCGGIYKETTGLINYPSDDTERYYKNKDNCTWILYAPEGMHIKLSWNRFNVEDSYGCTNDYLSLFEIDSENNNSSLGKFCGTKAPPSLTTTTNRLVMNFVSDTNVQLSGFSLSYSFLDERSHCGGTYVTSHGYIYSPGWPRPYEANRDCTWIIKVPMGQQIMLNITDFDVERPIAQNCNLGDYLEIRNGATQTAPLVGKFCGSFKSRKIKSTSNALYLAFHSDFYLNGNGFKIEWDGTVTGCGGILTSSTGSLTSPNYPDDYHENAECFYKIVVNPGSKIRFTFSNLDLEDSQGCKDDFVEIFDGRDENSPSLGKVCSMNLLKSKNFDTSTNYGFVKFRSDLVIGGKGFWLNYETICITNITGSYGVIESPGYPNNYRAHLSCLWTINVPKGNKINVTFTNFDIYQSTRQFYPWFHVGGTTITARGRLATTCNVDYLQYKELSDDSYSNKLCGRNLPPPISTKSSSLQIKFTTGAYLTRTGFRLEWVRDGCGGYLRKKFGSLSMQTGEVTSAELECEWVIETPIGTSVTITFSKLYMFDSKNCSVDVIEIYSGQNINSPMISRICHSGTSIFHSSSNTMFVKLIKKSALKDVNFISFFNSRPAQCGGMIQALSGNIHSKNYPQNYDDNSNCLWRLEVPQYHRIVLNITDLDLYSSPHSKDDNDCNDSIKIYDDYNLKYNYSYIVCSKSSLRKIISKAETLAIVFETDGHGNAKGFRASFSVTCGAIITGRSEGVISNNDFVSHSNESCVWTIIAPRPDLKIALTLTYISLPMNHSSVRRSHCPNSFLRVRDGSDENAPLIGEYCGRKVPSMVVSHGSAITLELGTYSDHIKGKFSAHYTTLNNACGGTIYSEEGHIASPNYPQSYPPNVNCEWILQTSPGSRVYITFEEFDLEYSEACNDEYLEIRENNGAGRLIAVYCGNNIPTNTSTATKLYLKFHSNGKKPGRGFLVNYGFLHGNDILDATSGVIASPLYPFKYDKDGDYSWHITSKSGSYLTISIDQLEIPSHGVNCDFSALTIYDGYDEDAPVLDTLCGVVNRNTKAYKSSSNVLFLKLTLLNNTGSIFLLSYTRSDAITQPQEDKINCGNNQTQLLIPGSNVALSTPLYPQFYESNLNCEWVYTTIPGYHISFQIDDIKLEETGDCFADYLSLYMYEENIAKWKQLGEKICLSQNKSSEITSRQLSKLKVIFKSDSSINDKGFKAYVQPVCGGYLSQPSGVFGPNLIDFSNTFRSFRRNKRKCDWTVKVRPGRSISLNFEHFNITNESHDCETYVIVRNGDSIEAPMLGDGKYCGFSHENRSALTTSSNSLFVTYVNTDLKYTTNFKNFKIRYEENRVECGFTSSLDIGHEWEIIKSPKYPSVPPPFTECIWIFTGPPGEILRIDFIDRFDVDENNECKNEFVEIRDGTSTYFPLKGRFCGDTPATVKTTNNNVYIKYVTQLNEPRNGFKANISIDVCGGTIRSDSGELTSPGYPHMSILPYGSICEWNIIGNQGHTFNIIPQEVKLPESIGSCETKVTVEETLAINQTTTVLMKFCNDDKFAKNSIIQTSSNRVTIKLYVGRRSPINYPATWTSSDKSKGFRFLFNSSRPTCGGFISTPEGFITSPGYPQETSLPYCQWIIQVPNRNRRVRLQILDINDNIRFGAFNDVSFENVIELSNYKNQSLLNRTIESTSNKLAIYLWSPIMYSKHRFKAKFSSDEPALCGGALTEKSGTLSSPDVLESFLCEWDFDYSNNRNSLNFTNNFQTTYVTITLNSSATSSSYCRPWIPRIVIKSMDLKRGSNYLRRVCSTSKISYRIPSTSMEIMASKQKMYSFSFTINWKLQPCGGVINVGSEPVDVLSQIPMAFNDTLECAWRLENKRNRIELKLEGTFELSCEDEFISISQGYSDNDSGIGYYCRDKLQESPISTLFSNIFVQYHSKARNTRNVKVMVKTTTSQCGGYLSKYYPYFMSPNYPNNYLENQECAWEINAEQGYRISLHFLERFAIEERPNCTKDVLIIYDWKDESWQEITRLCGRNMPPSFNSTLNRMKVLLRTDAQTNLEGFKATWTPICGGNYIANDETQFLYSPGYPSSYLSRANCEYNIISNDKEQQIAIKFIDFELEGTYPDCGYDNVTILTSDENTSNFYKFCGKEKPPLLYRSKGKISVVFRSDQFIQRRGFKLSYEIYKCGGYIKNATELSLWSLDEGITNCSWIIEAPSNEIVIVKFQAIDIDSSYQCYMSYVGLYEGTKIDDEKRLALYCGSINTTTVVESSNNTMTLQMFSSYSIHRTSKGFKARITFSYSTMVGCGGQINLDSSKVTTLKSPLIQNSVVYENFLDCQWFVFALEGSVIKVEFKSFHVAPCKDANQTSLGFNKCDCDSLDIRDGINPTSYLIQTYCGDTLPSQVISSSSRISLRFSTDGEVVSTGFEVLLSSQESVCGQSTIVVSEKLQRIRSPGFERGVIPRGINCLYRLEIKEDDYWTIHVKFNTLDLSPGAPDPGKCNKDKITMNFVDYRHNSSLGKDLILDGFKDPSFYTHSFKAYTELSEIPHKLELCGRKNTLDLYYYSTVIISLQTDPEISTIDYKGFELEVQKIPTCGRNYSDTEGRIQITSDYSIETDCNMLITAPENHTISLHFLSLIPDYWNEKVYLQVFDSNTTNSQKFTMISKEYNDNLPIFSTGRYLLLHNHADSKAIVTFDLNYLTTDKGRGCGGRLHNIIGKITSPLYPDVYRRKSSCVWDLETPSSTLLRIHFVVFDLGRSCDQNYLQLVDRNGIVLGTFCSEMPADFTSTDNYLKVVFTTTMNNGGSGWVAEFAGVV